MSSERCPQEEELLSFVDADLPPEQLGRIERHLELCSACAKRAMAFSELIADVAALPPAERLDVGAHVASVMSRLDEPVAAASSPRWAAWVTAAVAAAAMVLVLITRSAPPEYVGSRGNGGAPTLESTVGVQLYQQAEKLSPIANGTSIESATALTAGVRNASGAPLHLLLFAVDAKRNVHWLAPAYTELGTDPDAVNIAPNLGEQLLTSAAVFDDLAPGPLKVIAVLSREPLRVSQVESLSGAELEADAIRKRFASATLRELSLNVSAGAHQ
jgi:hypothetical protein